MSKLKQASVMEFRFQKTQASISGTGTPLVDPCTYSSAVFGGFVLLGYQDWSEDIGNTLCGVHKSKGSVAMTEKKRSGKWRFYPPLVGPLPSAILIDLPLPSLCKHDRQPAAVRLVRAVQLHTHTLL